MCLNNFSLWFVTKMKGDNWINERHLKNVDDYYGIESIRITSGAFSKPRF